MGKLYVLISLIWLGVFYAFMQSKKPQTGQKNEYWESGEWNMIYIVLFVIGSIFWWATTIFIIVYKLSSKYLFKK